MSKVYSLTIDDWERRIEMTDRYNALTVMLDRDIGEDDAQDLLNAIKMLRGVLTVTPHVTDFDSAIAEERARRELIDKIWCVLK